LIHSPYFGDSLYYSSSSYYYSDFPFFPSFHILSLFHFSSSLLNNRMATTLSSHQEQVQHFDLENEELCQTVLQVEDIVREKELQIQKLMNIKVDEPVPADYVAEAMPPPHALRDLSEV